MTTSKTTPSEPTGKSLISQLAEARQVIGEQFEQIRRQSRKIEILEKAIEFFGYSDYIQLHLNSHGVSLHKGYNINMFGGYRCRRLIDAHPEMMQEDPTTGCIYNPGQPDHKNEWVHYPTIGKLIQEDAEINRRVKEDMLKYVGELQTNRD